MKEICLFVCLLGHAFCRAFTYGADIWHVICLGTPYDHQIWLAGSLANQHYISGGFVVTLNVKGHLEVKLSKDYNCAS